MSAIVQYLRRPHIAHYTQRPLFREKFTYFRSNPCPILEINTNTLGHTTVHLSDRWEIRPTSRPDDSYLSHSNFMSVVLTGCLLCSAHDFEVLTPC